MLRSGRLKGLLCAIVLLGTALLEWAIPAGAVGEDLPIESVGRLRIISGDSRYQCTAFLIRSVAFQVDNRYYDAPLTYYRNYLVTAGHCAHFGHHYLFVQRGLGERDAYLIGFTGPRDDRGRPGWGMDAAVLTFATKEPMPTLTPAFGALLEIGEPLLTIGYGNGSLSAKVNPLLNREPDGSLVVGGWAQKGSSGSPVIRAGTRDVVGILIEGAPSGQEVCFRMDRCWWPEVYLATPIDRILGLVRW